MILARARYGGLAMMLPLAALFAATGEPGWRWGSVLALCLIVVGVQLMVSRGATLPMPLPLNMLAIGPSAMVLLTGGSSSPFIAVLFISVAGSALVSGPTRGLYVRLFGACVAALVGIFLADAPGFVPASLDAKTALGAVLAPWVWLYVLAVVVPGAGIVIGDFHTTLGDARRRELSLQREVVEGLRSRNAELTAISGALAHELKNPMAAIQGLATHLSTRAEAGSTQRGQLDVMVGEIHRVGGILDNLLDVSRPLTPLKMGTVELGEIAAHVVRIYETAAADQGVDLRAEGEGAMPGDTRKMIQVLVNLVQNALETGASVVSIRVSTDEAAAVVDVDDDGCGLPGDPAALFVAGVTHKPTGNGLGLAICATLVSQHGGTLILSNRPAGGCRARLRMPLGKEAV
jgi:signal transduction histidine kinase